MAQFARYPGSAVGAVGQGSPNTTANAWPVKPTDGTNSQAFTAAGAAKVDGSAVTQPVSAAALPLPSGAATSALQTSGNTSLSTIATNTPTVGQKTMAGSSPVVIASDQSAVPVSGTFWQATQPVSAATLPLPTGAATAAKQPALGTAGTPSTDVVTVQGAASMTALKVDGSAVTQPVSAASLPLPAGAATAAKQPAFGTPGTAVADVITVQGIASMTALKVDGSAVTQPISGAVTQTGIDYNTGAAGATTQRVTEAGRSKAWLARNDYTVTPVTTSAYVQLVASTAAATTRLRIFDSSGSAIILAIGAAASEVDTLYIPPGGWDGPVELQVAASSRVSLKALDATASVGQIIITALS